MTDIENERLQVLIAAQAETNALLTRLLAVQEEALARQEERLALLEERLAAVVALLRRAVVGSVQHLTVEDVMEALQVGRTTVFKWIEDGRLRMVLHEGKRKISLGALERAVPELITPDGRPLPAPRVVGPPTKPQRRRRPPPR